MVPFVTSMWMAAALAQAPTAGAVVGPEAAWLNAVPAEAEVVVRVRAPRAVRDDLAKMLQMMSPMLGQGATGALDNGLGMLAQRFGKDAQDSPMLAVARLPQKDDNGPPPFAVITQAKDYAAFQKLLAPEAKPKSQGGGIDELDADGQPPVFTAKGANYVVAGSSKDLVGTLARPKSGLDKGLSAELRERFLGGDAGVYVNLAAIQARYGEQIEQARGTFMDGLDKAAAANKAAPGMNMDAAKDLYGRMFDALKDGDALALHFDFDPQGLTVSGLAGVKSGSGAAKSLADPVVGTGEALAQLPDDAAFYTFMNLSPETFERFQKMAMAFMGGTTGKPSPEMARAMAASIKAGPKETAGAVSFGKGGMRQVNLSTFTDPKQAAEATEAMARAMKQNKSGLPDIIKDIDVQPAAQKYKGFSFTRTKVTFDKEKLAAMAPPNAPAAGGMSAMLGEGSTTWSGTDGKVFLSVVAPDWEKARGQIDAVLGGGKGTLGPVAGYQTIRKLLPRQVGSLFLISAQGLLKQGLAQFAAMAPDGPAGKVELKLPDAPALFGGALTPTPRGYQFRFVVPSSVGPVIEQGVGPIMQAVQQGNQVNKIDQ